ncbi:MAG: lysozyme inhibitor LprI family protein [Pseudolabrys sp.]
MRIVAGLLALLAFAVCAASARDKHPNPGDSNALQDCIKTSAPAGKSTTEAESCIGTLVNVCAPHRESMPSAAVITCIRRESVVWDDILNESFRRLRLKLDAAQQAGLRDMQRAWIASRDKTCAFYRDFYQGSMANPMVAECINRETGRRALFLLGFALEAENNR